MADENESKYDKYFQKIKERKGDCVLGNIKEIEEKTLKLLTISNPDDYQTEYEFQCISKVEEAINELYECFFDEKGDELT